MKKKQAFNPFLPLDEYIPDGEPHVFGDRVYLFGSHDKEGGDTFCMLDYVVYSAPVDDLTDWTSKGISYKAENDPAYPERKYMYAPDVVKGNDGRFYLYYCMSGKYGVGGYTEPISVAVCDTPDGVYEYLGHVKYKDGSLMKKYVCFDPAVINDNGIIRLYYGTQYDYEEKEGADNEKIIKLESEMFGRTPEEIRSYKDSIMGPVMLVLSDDMMTVREEPKHIIPYRVNNTTFAMHPFFEGSSIRKVGEKYYFIYSSQKNHELCYAISDYPDKGFVYGGTIVSNGDVGYNNRKEKDRLNMTGTTHGSIEKIKDQWYVFYHRLTHKTDYSRQACAEKIEIEEDGSIQQVEITSCGLNKGPLKGNGIYPAIIACNITNGHMPHGSNSSFETTFPNVNHENDERFIAEIIDGCICGYKYFEFSGNKRVGLVLSSDGDTDASSCFGIRLSPDGDDIVKINITEEENNKNETSSEYLETDKKWKTYYSKTGLPDGIFPVYFVYHGPGSIQIKDIIFE